MTETKQAPEAEEVENDDSTQETENQESSRKKQFKEFVDGTKRVGATIGEAFKGLSETVQGRQHVVMVRVNDESLNCLNQLVESRLFRSRSEGAAYLISKGIEAESKMFDMLESKVEEINKLRAELHDMARENFESSGEKSEK